MQSDEALLSKEQILQMKTHQKTESLCQSYASSCVYPKLKQKILSTK